MISAFSAHLDSHSISALNFYIVTGKSPPDESNGGSPCMFLFSQGLQFFMSVVQCLKTITSYPLAIFMLVYGGKANLVPVALLWLGAKL